MIWKYDEVNKSLEVNLLILNISTCCVCVCVLFYPPHLADISKAESSFFAKWKCPHGHFLQRRYKPNIPKPFAVAANYNNEEYVEKPPRPNSPHPCLFPQIKRSGNRHKHENNPYMIAAGVGEVSPSSLRAFTGERLRKKKIEKRKQD